MSPEELNATMEMLKKAAEEFAALPLDTVPVDVKVRMVSAQVRLESLRMSLASIQIVLQGRLLNPRGAALDDDAADNTYH
jgi:hypothetical protein